MILLHPFLGNRLRTHFLGPDFVIAEVALLPPLIVVSYHAPSSSATQEQYDTSISSLLSELTHLKSRSPPGTRLVLCGDLNAQLQSHPLVVGPWTNPCDRPPDLLRANSFLGAVEMLDLTVISSFFDLGPTRLAWPSAKRRGDTDSVIDYIAMTSTLKGSVKIPTQFPTITTSDHLPLHLTALAPVRDKRHRKHLMEKLLPTKTGTRIATTWKPKDEAAFRADLAHQIPATLQDLTTHMQHKAREHTQWEPSSPNPKANLLRGLREAQDPITRRAYQIQLRTVTREERKRRDAEQLQKWSSGASWTFSRPHRLPGPIRLPETLNDEPDRSKWGGLLQQHLSSLYGATETEREYAWEELNKVHREAFQPEMTTFLCHPEDIQNLISAFSPGKAGGSDGIPSQVIKHLTLPHYRIISDLFQQMTNNPAYKPMERPDHWNDAIVTMLAKSPNANQLENFRPISLLY